MSCLLDILCSADKRSNFIADICDSFSVFAEHPCFADFQDRV